MTNAPRTIFTKPGGVLPESIELVTSSLYLGPVHYYTYLQAVGKAEEDRFEHYVKQTFRNRCCIATPEGAQVLTIPVVRNGTNHTPMRDIRLSDHGNWKHLHWKALRTAYENSPFFEFYAYDLAPLYEKAFTFLVDFNEALREVVLDLLGVRAEVRASETFVEPLGKETVEDASSAHRRVDLRLFASPKLSFETDKAFRPANYFQVFEERTGFLPNLSIIDLLSNMGPESRLVMRASLLPA